MPLQQRSVCCLMCGLRRTAPDERSHCLLGLHSALNVGRLACGAHGSDARCCASAARPASSGEPKGPPRCGAAPSSASAAFARLLAARCLSCSCAAFAASTQRRSASSRLLPYAVISQGKLSVRTDMRPLSTRPASEHPLPHSFHMSAAGKRLPTHSSTVRDGLAEQISPSGVRFEGQRKPQTRPSSVVSTYIVQSLPTARPTEPLESNTHGSAECHQQCRRGESAHPDVNVVARLFCRHLPRLCRVELHLFELLSRTRPQPRVAQHVLCLKRCLQTRWRHCRGTHKLSRTAQECEAS